MALALPMRIKRNDTAPAFLATLRDGAGAAVDLTGATARFVMRDSEGATKVSAAATITAPAAGRVQYSWVAGDTDTVGTYAAEVEITFADATVQTFPSQGYQAVVVWEDLG